MAKRFTDTEKWKKKWIRELNPDMKLFWFYLLDNCDHAGIWEVDIDLASFQIGVKLDEARILKVFSRKIVPFKDGKWFIPKFIEYQYGELNENVNAHKSVIKILKKYGLNKKNQQLPNSSSGTVQDMDMDMDKVKDKGGEKNQLESIESKLSDYSEKYPTLNIQFYYDSFVDYLKAKGKQYKNYESAFNNCCRQEWYKERPGSYLSDKPKDRRIVIGCPDGHHQRKVNRGVYAVCPKCRTSMKPIEELQLKQAIA